MKFTPEHCERIRAAYFNPLKRWRILAARGVTQNGRPGYGRPHPTGLRSNIFKTIRRVLRESKALLSEVDLPAHVKDWPDVMFPRMDKW